MANDACSPQVLTAADGAQLITCAHGGQVLGWTPAGGRPRIWLSPTAECGPGLALRGGVPVIFPQFAGRGPLPKHGLARDRAWTVTQALGSPEAALWTARLVDDDQTRAIWPHAFELTVRARAAGSGLDLQLTVRNTGDEPWSFMAALHSYLTLGDPGTTITGLGGRTASDNAADGATLTLGGPGETLVATTTRDVAVSGVHDPVVLDDPVAGPLIMTASGFDDRVVWNPGPEHSLADVPPGAESGFVCIEPAALDPRLLAPGSAWTGTVRLETGTASPDA